jgi:hypothetical protein
MMLLQTKQQLRAPGNRKVKMKTRLSLQFVAVLVLLAVVAGCSDWERAAFQTISSAKAVIDQASEDYNAGRIEKSDANYQLLLTAQHAKDAAAQSLLAYDDAKTAIAAQLQAGSIDKPAAERSLSAARAATQAILADLPPLLAKLQHLIHPAPAPSAKDEILGEPRPSRPPRASALTTGTIEVWEAPKHDAVVPPEGWRKI